MSRVKVALAGVVVRQAMITHFQTLSPGDPLSRAVDLTLSGYQQDFPVMDGARLVGVLTQGDLLRGLATRDRSIEVNQVMRSEFETAEPTDALDGALTRLHQGDGRMLMVKERERVVGILTVENIGELLALEAAGRPVAA